MDRWRAYLESLENGVATYPDVVCKASVTRSFYESFGRPTLPAEVPVEVRQLALQPPPLNVFVPEVHARIMYLAMADALHLPDQEMVDRCHQANKDLVSGPIYRAIFAFVSTERLVHNIPSRWNAFHRGTRVIVEALEKNRGTIVLEEPPKLSTDLLARMHATAFATGVEASGARDVKTETQLVPRGTRICVSWTS